MRSRSILPLALLLLAGPSLAQPPSPDAVEIAAKVRALQHEIDALLAGLPPELRAEVERLLAEPAPERLLAEPMLAPVPEPEPPPAAQEPPTSELPPLAPAPSSERFTGSCAALAPFDTDADGDVDALDRHWRYLSLWVDADNDGRMGELEIESVYDRGVKAISVSLESFRKGQDETGEIALWGEIRLDLGGRGLAESARRSEDGVLVIDATRLRRGDGPRLLAQSGELLDGFQILRKGLRLKNTDGAETTLSCP